MSNFPMDFIFYIFRIYFYLNDIHVTKVQSVGGRDRFVIESDDCPTMKEGLHLTEHKRLARCLCILWQDYLCGVPVSRLPE